MHEGDHGILDEVEDHDHVHNETSASLNKGKITGLVALTIALIIIFRIFF